MSKRFVISDTTKENSHGFTINLEGLDMARFNANPVMFYQHDREHVIGRWENISVENSKLMADPIFDEEDELGREVSRKVAKGFLKGASLGIYIKEMDVLNGKYIAKKSELREVSIVTIPSDAGAISLYDEDNKVMTLSECKLKLDNEIKNKSKIKMDKENLLLSPATMTSLGLTGEVTPKCIDLAVAEKDRKITELEAQLAAEKKNGINTYLDAAVSAGKIDAKEKDSFAKLAEKDFESVKNIIDAKEEKQSEKLADMAKGGKGTVELDWDTLDKAGKLLSLKRDQPDVYKELYNKKFNK